MLTEFDILAALRDCYDPAIPCNIVDLGLVRDVQVQVDLNAPGATIPGVPRRYRVAIQVTPTNQDESSNAQLSAQIQNRLAGIEQILQTTVKLLESPVWTPQSITAVGRRTLGLDGNRNLIQISSKAAQ
jgi:metal-sulfur cluster biosynthetic enzyme